MWGGGDRNKTVFKLKVYLFTFKKINIETNRFVCNGILFSATKYQNLLRFSSTDHSKRFGYIFSDLAF